MRIKYNGFNEQKKTLMHVWAIHMHTKKIERKDRWRGEQWILCPNLSWQTH